MAPIPIVTFADLEDYCSAGRDSTGRCREDNPLREWDPGEYDDEAPPWLAEEDNTMSRRWEWSYAKINDDQYAACSPVFFDSFYLVALITRRPDGSIVAEALQELP